MSTTPYLPIHENIKSKLQYFYETQKIPHLIFHGSPGTGKRTLVYDFLNKIYGNDKYKLKTNVMFVNCAHGKGIKFIRDELKFFAKTNIKGAQNAVGVMFKTIVLFNADSLTIDAQSALRRCIELFSYNTRFFIVVENKHKLLNPILSRFCEIYVAEFIDPKTGKTQNLHQYHLNNIYGEPIQFDDWFNENVEPIIRGIVTDDVNHMDIANGAYEKGISCLNLVDWIQRQDFLSDKKKAEFAMHFEKIKSEYRCEKMLFLCLLRLREPRFP
jgi:replication factor C subunit 3/5